MYALFRLALYSGPYLRWMCERAEWPGLTVRCSRGHDVSEVSDSLA